MSKRKPDKKEKLNEVNEPVGVYNKPALKRSFVFFNSFEELQEHELIQMAMLSPLERFQQMRRFINIAYGMHGYDPDNVPKKRLIKIIRGEKLK